MQKAENLNWLVVAIPSAITGCFLILVQVLIAFWLTKVTERTRGKVATQLEDYKKDISKELENHRSSLQSDFQARLYAFQTKYSVLHEKRAAAIEQLFSLLARVQNDLQIWAAKDRISLNQSEQEFFFKTRDDFRKLIDFFDEKRIYFDDETSGMIRPLVGIINMVLESQESIESVKHSAPHFANQMKENANNLIEINIHPLMNRLEDKFKVLLSAELPVSAPISKK
jgi:hypothetical protein